MELYELTVSEIASKIKNKEVTIKQVLDSVFDRIENVEKKVDGYITVMKEEAYKRADMLQEKLDLGENIGVLGGVPIAVKDNICTNGSKTTCASKMLENFVPFYDATVVEKLYESGAIIIGKTNMDEFAMGSSTESSYFKKTKNPWDLEKVPGGSSGGSAAVVSSDMAYASLGTDTGGSIRQPASFCSVVGLKPTYGLVSRYGVVAYASSLDQVGPITKNVEDAALMLNVISGNDKKDTTSVNMEKVDYTKAIVNDVSGKKIGVLKTFVNEGVSEDVKRAYEKSINVMKDAGAEIIEIELENIKYSLPTYYILANAEASSNLGRYDGIRFGHRASGIKDLEDLYVKSRTEGFGEEVKRRILVGTYVLSSGYYDAYYKRASSVRTLIINELKKAFENVDCIMIPTSPNTAFKFGEKSKNPIEMYLEDIYTVPVNIAGLPGISVPAGFCSKGMPIGIQFISKAFNEKELLQIAYTFEQNIDCGNEKPTL